MSLVQVSFTPRVMLIAIGLVIACGSSAEEADDEPQHDRSARRVRMGRARRELSLRTGYVDLRGAPLKHGR